MFPSSPFFMPTHIIECANPSESPELRMVPVRSSYTGQLPWAPDHAICFVEFIDKDGAPFEHCGR